jgi:ABC-type multidrug transport system ATPase subunit
MNVIETAGLTKRYGKVDRVKNLSLHIPAGCIYGFLGPNGAGKSTTLKMVLGLVHPTAGSVTVLGQRTNDKNRLAVLRNVGSLIESPSYYGHLTGEENLQIAATLRGLSQKDIDEALAAVRLGDAKKRLVKHYSLGMKQRLGLATALLGRPQLLILDEPTNGLDPAGIQEMRELICTLPHKYGMTVVVSSHLLAEIDQMATVTGIIREGELVFEGTMAELHAHSRHGLAVRTQDNAKAAALLMQQGLNATLDGEAILLPLLDDAAAMNAARLLADSEAGLLRMEERQSSLEDIFLHLTGKAASL